MSFYDRSFLDILDFKEVPGKNRLQAYFRGNHEKLVKAEQPTTGEYPHDITAEANMIFVKTKIKKQHVAGMNLPLMRIIDTEKQLSIKTSCELNGRLIKFSPNSIQEVDQEHKGKIQIKLISRAGKTTVCAG